MIETPGDLWAFPAQYVCVTTNGITRGGSLVMGAGVALEAKRRFPGLPKKLGGHVARYGNRAFFCRPEGVITFPTKRHWRDPSDVKLIRTSAQQVVDICNKFAVRSVALPRPGCGNGGLTWDFVRPYIEDILDERFTVVGS